MVPIAAAPADGKAGHPVRVAFYVVVVRLVITIAEFPCDQSPTKCVTPEDFIVTDFVPLPGAALDAVVDDIALDDAVVAADFDGMATR